MHDKRRPATMKRLISIFLVLALLVCTIPAQAAAGTLRRGSKGREVTKLQNALKGLGYYTMAVDGKYGKGTEAAVKAYQKKNGLAADGIAGPKTQGKLYGSTAAAPGAQAPSAETAAPAAGAVSSSSLSLGSNGSKVSAMQEKLWYLGYYTGSADGNFGTDTYQAVAAFQKAKGLKKDGIAGKKTLSALETAWKAAKTAAGSLPDEAAALLNRIAAGSGAACGTLVLSKNGQTFLTWSFGGVNDRTCFRIASITKWVTAIGLMTLYDQGRLDLDRDISEYLPFQVRNPAWPGTPVTARMLLSHTSSLSPDATVYRPDWERIGKNGYDPVFDESIRPGTQYAYADYNGALFGGLIEAITGESVQNYVNRMVFAPLGVTAAYSPNFLPAGTPAKDTLKANGRVAISVKNDRDAKYNNTADPKGNNGYTVGRLYISTAALTRLAQMMLSGGSLNGVKILEPSTVALMEADQPGLAESRYGLSTVRHNQFPGGTWYGHQGRYSGLTSNIYYQRETGITLALVMDGYDYQLQDNIVMPAVMLLNNMEMLSSLSAPVPGQE